MELVERKVPLHAERQAPHGAEVATASARSMIRLSPLQKDCVGGSVRIEAFRISESRTLSKTPIAQIPSEVEGKLLVDLSQGSALEMCAALMNLAATDCEVSCLSWLHGHEYTIYPLMCSSDELCLYIAVCSEAGCTGIMKVSLHA